MAPNPSSVRCPQPPAIRAFARDSLVLLGAPGARRAVQLESHSLPLSFLLALELFEPSPNRSQCARATLLRRLVEVLSPRREKRDRTAKLRIYAREAVPHAWLINPEQRTLEVFSTPSVESRSCIISTILASTDGFSHPDNGR